MKGLITNPYLAIAAGVLVAAGNIAGLYDASIMLAILGVIGFGSIAQLRDAIRSVGKTTYITAGLGAATIGLYAFKVIDEQATIAALSIILPVAAQRLKKGIDKANKAS